MSMRIEYRWIDYLIIFSDAKYLYYYEFLDNLSREYIMNIESEIINLYKSNRNPYFQTEYFYCEDYNDFHQTIINVLNTRNIKYNYYDKHNFNRRYYDNKQEYLLTKECIFYRNLKKIIIFFYKKIIFLLKKYKMCIY